MSVAPTRTQKRQKETRERIFRVAMELFIKNGFENTTVSEITEAADIGKGTFFTYFPTKEAIFRQLGVMMMENMSAAARQGLAAGQPVSRVLKDTLLVSAIWHENNKPITRQMIQSNFYSSADFSNKGRFLELLMELIRSGKTSGEFGSAIDARDAAIVLVGTYFAAVAFWVLTEDVSLRERFSNSIDVILNGLRVV